MRLKKLYLLFGILFLTIFFVGIVDAVNSCWIEAGGETDCKSAPGGQVVMGLSDVTNAHGELKINNQELNYPVVLCCNFGNGVQANCPPSEDTILFLSSATNAHGEIPGGSYTVEICYANVNCEGGTTQPAGKTAILSLSGTGTNSHIGGPNDYNIKIWCEVGTFCGDGTVQNDPPNDDGLAEDCDSGANCIAPGETNECTCPDGYTSDGINGCEWAGSALAYWSDIISGNRLYTSVEPLGVIVGTTTVGMTLFDPFFTNGEEFYFEVWEKDAVGDDEIRTGANVIDGIAGSGMVASSWTITSSDIDNAKGIFGPEDEYEFYFKAYESDGTPIGTSEDLISTVIQAPVCEAITICMDYGTLERCENDLNTCKVAELSVELIQDDENFCDDMICDCWWDITTSTCNSKWGLCKYGESTEIECSAENLFLTYSWGASWNDGGESPANDCIGGQNVVPCPAKIQLPFFNTYSIIAIIIVMVLIYFALSLRKKRKSDSKRKKRKKR